MNQHSATQVNIGTCGFYPDSVGWTLERRLDLVDYEARVVLHVLDVPVDVCIQRVLESGGDDAQALADTVLRDCAHLDERTLADEARAYSDSVIVTD